MRTGSRSTAAVSNRRSRQMSFSRKVARRARTLVLDTRHTPHAKVAWKLGVLLSIIFVLTTPVLGAAGSPAPRPGGPIVVVAAESTSVSLSWTASPDRSNVAAYDVYVNGTFVDHAMSTSYTAEGLKCGTTYVIAVLAFDRAGSRSESVTAVVATRACASPKPSQDNQPPSAPGNLTQTATSATSIAMAWKHATDNTAVAGYRVFVNNALAGSTSTLTYVVGDLACGKIYAIAVEAFDAAGNSSPRTPGAMSTSACSSGGSSPAPAPAPAPPKPGGGKDTTPPSTPSGLAVSNLTVAGLTLSWKSSTDNVAVAGYDVYLDAQKLGTTKTTSLDVPGLTCGTSYALGVEAFDAAGNRAARATLPALTPPCPPTGGGGAAATLFVAVNGSDKGSCTKAAPCASFERAFGLAGAGSVVEVAAGSYPLQVLTSAGKGGGVVFRPAAGASVTLAEFVSGDTKTKVGARGFELRDFKISSYVRLRWGSEDVTLRNIDAGGLNVTSASRVQVLGGDYGPMVDGVSHINACGIKGCYPAEDVVIDGAYFHDYTVTDPAKHSECLMIWPGRRVTIRNSTFRNCTDFDILVKPYNTGLVGLPGEITLENNSLDEPIIGDGCFCQRGGNAIALTQGGGESWSGANVRYNSSLGGIRIDPMIKNAVIKGNIARKDTNYSCQTNISYSYNIWSGAKCSPTDQTAPLSTVFVGATSATFDLRLKDGWAAKNVGAGGR